MTHDSRTQLGGRLELVADCGLVSSKIVRTLTESFGVSTASGGASALVPLRASRCAGKRRQCKFSLLICINVLSDFPVCGQCPLRLEITGPVQTPGPSVRTSPRRRYSD